MSSRKTTIIRWIAAVIGIGVVAVLGIGQTKQPPAQVLLLNLRLVGFEPPAATANAGQVFLVVHNRTGRPKLNLHIAPQKGGGGQTDIHSDGRNVDISQFLTLSAGSYVITESSEGKWTCQLTVK